MPEPTSACAPPARLRLGPDRISLVPVLFLLLGSLPLAASAPWLGWLVLVPLGCALWVLRARVVAVAVGVEVCNGLRATRVAWSDVEGVDVPRRGPLRLLRRTGRSLPMTALPRRDLPRLLAFGQSAAARPAAAPEAAAPGSAAPESAAPEADRAQADGPGRR